MLAFPTLSSRRARRASDGSVVCAVTRTRSVRERRRGAPHAGRAPPRGPCTPDTCVLPARRHADRARTPTGSARPQTQSDLAAWRGGRSGDRQTGAKGRVECDCEWGRAERGESSAARRRRERAVLLSRIPAIIPTATPPSAPRGHGLGKLRFALAIGPGRRPATVFLRFFLPRVRTAAPARRYTRYLRPLALTGARSTTPAAGATAARAARARSAGRGRTGRPRDRGRERAFPGVRARLAPRYGITAAGNAAVPRRASYFVL